MDEMSRFVNSEKVSLFNEYIGKIKEGYVIYNNLTGGMIEVPEYIYNAVKKNRIEDIVRDDFITDLRRGKFIVDSTEEEVESLVKKREELTDSAYSFALQIIPSMSCNFKCTYCFVDIESRNTLISPRVMDAIEDYVKRTIKPTTKHFSVSWFGGEPLLGIKQIQHLSRFFIDICRTNNIKYESIIVTNGYLLTPRVVDTLIENSVVHYQVTVDGPEEVHNKRRMLQNGNGTYKTIIEHLKYLVTKKVGIVVRINIDKSNIQSVKEIVAELGRQKICPPARIHFGRVQNFNKNACQSVMDDNIGDEEREQYAEDYGINKLLKEITIPMRPKMELLGCLATTKLSLIVGPRGELYKCLRVIGVKEQQCGTIFDVNYNEPVFKKWSTCNRLFVEQCRGCSMMPVCSGNGCAFDFVVKNKKTNECRQAYKIEKYHELLKTLYFKKTGMSEISEKINN